MFLLIMLYLNGFEFWRHFNWGMVFKLPPCLRCSGLCLNIHESDRLIAYHVRKVLWDFSQGMYQK